MGNGCPIPNRSSGFRDDRCLVKMGIAGLIAIALSPVRVNAALMPSADGTTVYDTVNNVTWLADVNLAASTRFGLAACVGSSPQPNSQICVNPSGSMNFPSAAAWVKNMNAAGYRGHSNWQLPTTPMIDGSCPFVGPNGNSFGFTCTASALGSLYYNGLGLKAPNTAVPIPSNTVGPFTNFQPYLYWSQSIMAQNGYSTFSFNSGFLGANTVPNYLYALPMIPGKLAGTPPATGTALQVNPGAQTVYDPVANVTWLANANLAASTTFGIMPCTSQGAPKPCVGQDGAMNWDSANQFVMNMNTFNGTGYLGQTHWQLPPVDTACGGYNCADNGNPMGELFYGQLGLSHGTPVVAAPNITVGPFRNIQPYLYWSCEGATVRDACGTAGPAPSFEWTFSFGNGFLGTDLLGNEFYVTAYFVGPPGVAPTPVISSVQDAESARTTVVPGEWAAIYGSNLATPGTPCASDAVRVWCAKDFSGGTAQGSPLPKSLDGTSVTFNGTPAAVYYILPTQIAVQVPTLSSGPASVVVSNSGTVSATFTATIAQSAPSFFINPVGGHTYPAAVHNFQPVTYVGDPAIAGPGYQKAHPGEVLIMYVNGLTAATAGQITGGGPNLSSQVTVMAGSTPLIVSYAALVTAGEFQLNVTVPQSLAAGEYPLTVSYQGNSSPAGVTLPVGQ